MTAAAETLSKGQSLVNYPSSSIILGQENLDQISDDQMKAIFENLGDEGAIIIGGANLAKMTPAKIKACGELNADQLSLIGGENLASMQVEQIEALDHDYRNSPDYIKILGVETLTRMSADQIRFFSKLETPLMMVLGTQEILEMNHCQIHALSNFKASVIKFIGVRNIASMDLDKIEAISKLQLAQIEALGLQTILEMTVDQILASEELEVSTIKLLGGNEISNMNPLSIEVLGLLQLLGTLPADLVKDLSLPNIEIEEMNAEQKNTFARLESLSQLEINRVKSLGVRNIMKMEVEQLDALRFVDLDKIELFGAEKLLQMSEDQIIELKDTDLNRRFIELLGVENVMKMNWERMSVIGTLGLSYTTFVGVEKVLEMTIEQLESLRDLDRKEIEVVASLDVSEINSTQMLEMIKASEEKSFSSLVPELPENYVGILGAIKILLFGSEKIEQMSPEQIKAVLNLDLFQIFAIKDGDINQMPAEQIASLAKMTVAQITKKLGE